MMSFAVQLITLVTLLRYHCDGKATISAPVDVFGDPSLYAEGSGGRPQPTKESTLRMGSRKDMEEYEQERFGNKVDRPDGMEKQTMKMPKLSEEEEKLSQGYRATMFPLKFRCDACQAVSFQVWTQLTKFHQDRISVKRMSETNLYALIEKGCSRPLYEHYGVKGLEGGENVLSGPGTPSKEFPGVMHGGGSWPIKMKDFCDKVFYDSGYELDEEIVYDHFLNTDSLEKFSRAICTTVKECTDNFMPVRWLEAKAKNERIKKNKNKNRNKNKKRKRRKKKKSKKTKAT